jgi:hypothetical protein
MALTKSNIDLIELVICGAIVVATVETGVGVVAAMTGCSWNYIKPYIPVEPEPGTGLQPQPTPGQPIQPSPGRPMPGAGPFIGAMCLCPIIPAADPQVA